jgi:hypothetical protein
MFEFKGLSDTRQGQDGLINDQLRFTANAIRGLSPVATMVPNSFITIHRAQLQACPFELQRQVPLVVFSRLYPQYGFFFKRSDRGVEAVLLEGTQEAIERCSTTLQGIEAVAHFVGDALRFIFEVPAVV